jgi:hypothetical protein
VVDLNIDLKFNINGREYDVINMDCEEPGDK